jgi:GNAT superfamily N-acetyltransferase
VIRPATRADIPAMHRVRMAVRENVLVNVAAVTEAAYLLHLETEGRGWVIEEQGEIVALAIGNSRTGNIWALFVHPEHEGRGHGLLLHDQMVAWLFEQGLQRLRLSTEPGTRAQRFYERAGWRALGLTPQGEAAYELLRPATAPP